MNAFEQGFMDKLAAIGAAERKAIAEAKIKTRNSLYPALGGAGGASLGAILGMAGGPVGSAVGSVVGGGLGYGLNRLSQVLIDEAEDENDAESLLKARDKWTLEKDPAISGVLGAISGRANNRSVGESLFDGVTSAAVDRLQGEVGLTAADAIAKWYYKKEIAEARAEDMANKAIAASKM